MKKDLTFNQLTKEKKDCEDTIEKAITKAIDVFESNTGLCIEKVKASVSGGTNQSLSIVYVKIYTNIESIINKS